MEKYLKIALILLAVIWLAGCGPAQTNEKEEERKIRSAIQSRQTAYNQQDASKLAALWTDDATYTNPLTRESAEGKEAIEKLFREKFTDGKKRDLEIVIKSIEFPHANEAVEKGVMKVTIGGQPAQQMAYQVEYVKENGNWLMQAFNEIELQDPSSHFKQLKDLTWLLGKWTDSDDHIQILFDNQWDKYKNFITQHFKLEIYGQESIEGKQIIAWDPIKGVIRSWVFDSDGGFGEGTWEKVDTNWFATMRYTLGDGRSASSKNIYTPVDDHSYTFASVEREVDGEILPDMDPVTVKKID